MKLTEITTYFAVFTGYVGVIGIVFILGFSSPTQKQLIQEHIVSKSTISIFASVSHVGRFLGNFVMLSCYQLKINSNTAVLVSSVIGGIGWLMVIIASSSIMAILGASLVGVYTGITIFFIQTYIGEITLSSQRRVASGGIGFCFRISLFCVYALGIWLSFRWLAAVGLLFICIFCLLLTIIPKSPEWYVSQGVDERAKHTLFYLHGKDFDADSELQNIRNNIADNKFTWTDSINALKNWKVLKPIILISVFTCCKEFGGHEAMVSFSSHILENQQRMDARLASLFYPTFLTAGAVVSLIILNSCKLKWQIILGALLQAFSHLSMAVYYFVSENHLHCLKEYSQICQTISFWPIFNIALYAFGFSLGWGLTFFSLIGILIVSYRGISLLLTSAATNISMFTIINMFYYLLNTIGGFSTFLCLASVNLISIVFVYFSLHF